MDTRSKKYHKLAVILILLTVILPSVFLVSLYPQMEAAANLLREEYIKEFEEARNNDAAGAEYVLVDDFINRATETNYCIYGELLEENSSEKIDWRAIYEYGWNEDRNWVLEEVRCDASLFIPSEEGGATHGFSNSDRSSDGVGKLIFEYDQEGNVLVTLEGDIDWTYWTEGKEYLEEIERDSQLQYENNVRVYNNTYGEAIEASQLRPKNFRAEYTLFFDEYGGFLIPSDAIYEDYDYYFYHNTSIENLYLETGSFLIVICMAVLVAIVAMVLPCLKVLGTGRERIFSFMFEIMLFLAGCVIAGACGMYFAMAYTNRYMLAQITFPNFIGSEITTDTVYNICRALNVLGWSLVFFVEYMVISNIRQIICDIKGYFKNQSIIGKVLKWAKRKILQFYHYATEIDFKEDMNKGILKIVLVNFVVLTVLCCLWVFGVAGLLIYSVILFWLLQKVGKKWKSQYDSVLQATQQMAKGDLKIELDEELGLFEPMGESLKQVQEGFKKAVVEEAKSQNMKSELITNVSHDLKTPLTAIITYVDLLKKDDITEEQRKSYIATLDQKSQRLKVLIEDLFEVSKANSGNVKMNVEDINVVSLLRQVRSEMDEEIQNSHLQFRWNLPEEKLILSLDGQRMYRVFENLIRNALKYSMPYSRVYVDVLSHEQEVKIVFRNMSANEMNYDPDQLTERFVRGDVSRNSEGSGLGLAIVKSFVELQNGTFKIEVDGDLFKAIISFQK